MDCLINESEMEDNAWTDGWMIGRTDGLMSCTRWKKIVS